VSGNFLPFKEESHSRSSQAAWFFSFAKGKKSLLQRNPAHMTRAIDKGPEKSQSEKVALRSDRVSMPSMDKMAKSSG
jgi:hypothetical protein